MFVGSKVNDTRYEVTIPANTTHNSRSATFRWVQEETSDQQSRIITQAAADNDYEFKITWTSGSNYAQTISTTYPAVVTASDYKTFYIRSRKNGATFNSITGFTSDASWITVTSTTSFTYSISENTGSSSRTGTLTLTQGESGKKCYINITQQGADVEEWRYTFNVTPTVVNFSSSGGSQSVTVESFRELYVNGVYQSGSKEFVNWNSSEYIAWASTVDNQTSLGTYKGTCTITAIANSTTSDRSGEVLITQSDMSGTNSTVRVTQAAKVEDVYVFTWGDGSVTDLPTGPFKANEPGFTIGLPKVPIISTKNGATHGYSVTSKPSWTTVDISSADAIVIAIDKNTSPSSRNGSIILTQNDSGNTLTITISQTGYTYEFQWVSGVVVEDTYTLTVAPGHVFDSSDPVNNLVSSRSVDNWSTNAELVNFTAIDTPELNWLTVTPIAPGDPSDNPGLFDVFFSGTVPDSETTYTVQFLQHESAKACLLKIVVVDAYRFVFTDNNLTTMTKNIDSRGQVVMGEWGVKDEDLFLLSYKGSTYVGWEWSSDSSWVYMFDDGEYFNIEADRNPNVSARTGVLTFTQKESGKKCTLTVNQQGEIDVSASCRFYGSFGTIVSSDHSMGIPLTSVVDFDGSTSNVASYLTIPAIYNMESDRLQLNGEVSFNVEANNNTTNSMTSITVELLCSTTESDIGTDYGSVLASWTEHYPVGGKYITVEAQNETINSGLIDVTEHNVPIYVWFITSVVYSGWDNPMVSCTTSSINFNITND